MIFIFEQNFAAQVIYSRQIEGQFRKQPIRSSLYILNELALASRLTCCRLIDLRSGQELEFMHSMFDFDAARGKSPASLGSSISGSLSPVSVGGRRRR